MRALDYDKLRIHIGVGKPQIDQRETVAIYQWSIIGKPCVCIRDEGVHVFLFLTNYNGKSSLNQNSKEMVESLLPAGFSLVAIREGYNPSGETHIGFHKSEFIDAYGWTKGSASECNTLIDVLIDDHFY